VCRGTLLFFQSVVLKHSGVWGVLACVGVDVTLLPNCESEVQFNTVVCVWEGDICVKGCVCMIGRSHRMGVCCRFRPPHAL